MKHIYLLRHGTTEPSAERCFLGQREVALSEEGRRQMRRCGEVLKEIGVDRLHSSPLSRCRESAALIADQWGIKPVVEKGLAEIDLGAWDGLAMATVQAHQPEAFAARGKNLADFRPPGGESFRDLARRSWPVFERICRLPGHTAIVVAHAGVNRTILCRILGIPLTHLFRLGQDHAAINVIECRDQGLHCRTINWTPLPLPPSPQP